MGKIMRTLLLFIMKFFVNISSVNSKSLNQVEKLWDRQTFPNINKNKDGCSGVICDPDGVLSEAERSTITNAVLLLSSLSVKCDNHQTKFLVDKKRDSTNLEMAVVLMNKMQVPENVDEELHAQEFAIGLHNDWGIGSKSESCNGDTGIVFFFCIESRVFYISIGSALKSTLTDGRLDIIIDGMREYLRQAAYGEAIDYGTHLTVKYLTKGPPGPGEKFVQALNQYFSLMFMAFILAVMSISNFFQEKEKKEYARARSQLSKLERDQALVLQGNYNCTSCPICLEDFQGFSCTVVDGSNDKEFKTPRIGSDGLPLKLLRCGHVFDETCWEKYVSTGQGEVHTCPICKKHVGKLPLSRGSQNNLRERNVRNEGGVDLLTYERERNFRLMRLHARFPRFIDRSQLVRWTQIGFRDSYTNDCEFVQRDPTSRINQANNHSSFGDTGVSFGGGSSGGGRGGRW